MEDKPLRKLKIDLSDLMMAMDDASGEHSYYLDLETGDILGVFDETRRQLEQIYDESSQEESDEEDFDLESALKQMDLPDWQKETLRDAYRVEQGFGDRYISIPRADSSEGFDDMEDFAETIQNPSLRGRLARSLSMNHPFRRFKDVLANIPDLEEQWFKFHEGRQKERVLEWLADEGIELNSESS